MCRPDTADSCAHTAPPAERAPGCLQVAEVKSGIEGIADGLHGTRKMPLKVRLSLVCCSHLLQPLDMRWRSWRLAQQPQVSAGPLP